MNGRRHDIASAAHRWFGKRADALDETESRVLSHAVERRILTRDPNDDLEKQTFGERLADKVAEFGGSWTFIIVFCVFLAAWAAANIWLLTRPFDPYPFIFLNLMLSMVAALQAPVIMMSQNRQGAKDRENATRDYEVNLKAEIEIMALHDKLDRLRDEQIIALVEKQQEQIRLLTDLLTAARDARGS